MSEPQRAAGTSPTQRLAEFAATLTFAQLPEAVVAKAKLCLLDTLGCCVFGASLPSVGRLTAMVAAEGAAKDSAVIGAALRTSPALAALVNSTAAHAFQLDEIHLESTLHPGSVALPPALAVAERLGTPNGRDLVTAIIAAYEVGIRIGLAAKGGMFKSGFHNQGTAGAFVAAVAAARMLGLNALQMQHALGIAGSQAAGLMAVQDGAMTKSFHSGHAAQAGVYAAQLAQRGYTGIPDVLDGAYGTFFPSFLEDWSDAPLAEGLGTHWHTLRVGFKPAPAANGSITAMTAIDRVMREHGLCAGDIETITVHVSHNTLHHCGWPYEAKRIQSVLSAQMSLRYGIAVMALERQATPEQFAESKIRDPQILQFIPRISVEHDPKFDGDNGRYRVGCHLMVHASNRRQYETTVLYRKGSPEDPMSENELKDKFQALANNLGPGRVEQIVDVISKIDRCDDLAGLSRLLEAT
ncbi:MAG TPA: MmgE/PrpD family protein [Pseudolabrys sp.]|nr:MmgE/PrpD family protein [Pseudolabrys sp.]